MKHLYLSLPLYFLVFACQNNSTTSDDQNDDFHIDTISILESIKVEDIAEFNAIKKNVFAPDLPYVIDDKYLDYINPNDYKYFADSLSGNYIVDADPEADYYLVARPIEKDKFTTLIILESKLDTLYNASDKFFLYTFTPDGYVIANIVFAANVTGKKHFKTIGILTNSLQVKTYKYEYYLKNGEWVKKKQPIKTVLYEIDSTGHIDIKDSKINIEDDEDKRII